MRLLTWLPGTAGLVSIREAMRGLRDWTSFCLPASYVLLVIGPTVTAPLTLWEHWIAFALGTERQITAESAPEQTYAAFVEDAGRFTGCRISARRIFRQPSGTSHRRSGMD